MSNRTMILLAVVLGLLAGMMNCSYLSAANGQSVTVYRVKSGKGIKSGEPIPIEALEEIKIQGDVATLKRFAMTPEDFAAYKDRPLAQSVEPGSLLLLSDYRVSGDTGVGSEVGPGERAFSVSTVDETKAVAYFVHPGDVVDVWGTVNGKAYLLKDHARVAAVGDVYQPGDKSDERKYRSVTLVVSAKDIEGLVHNIALAGGAVTLTLLGGEDAKAPSGPALDPITVTKEAGATAARPAPRPTTTTTTAPAAPLPAAPAGTP